MKNLILLIIPILFGLSACNERECVDLNKERENIELVLEKYVIAFEDHKMELAEEIWADDEKIIAFGTGSDEQLIGWKAIRNTIQKQFDTFSNTYISISDQNININKTGNTAWFSEIMNYNFIRDSVALSYEGIRYTGVLEKRDGKWVIVQSHVSVPEK